MNERMKTVRSEEERRQQQTPLGADRPEAAVNPPGPDGGPSSSAAQPAASSRKETVYLMEQVVSHENMLRALKRVEANRGAPGNDGLTVEELRPYLRTYWATIRQDLLGDQYRPQSVRRVEIPKPGGGIRQLGIPTVLDRLIQQALLQVLTPIFDPDFVDESYGFRPGRSAHDAIRAAQEHLAAGYEWVVDMDLEKFFDRVNHDILMSRVARKVTDKRVLRLIRRYLQAGAMVEGVVMPTEEGTPQGGPLSPLLANILLDDLDRELKERGHRFVRYADDCNIYVRSERAGQRVLKSLTQWLRKRLKLRVNEQKSGVRRATQSKFLGFSFYRSSSGPRIRLASTTKERVKARLRHLTRRNWSISMEDRLRRIRRYLQGWLAYFALADCRQFLRQLMQWLRRRLRACSWVQWKRVRTRFRKLRALGTPEWLVRLTAFSRRGPWFMAGGPLNGILTVDYWRQLGLIDLPSRYMELCQRL